MGVRNCKELGPGLQRIIRRLLANQNLCKLLYYTDKNPLSHSDFEDTTILYKDLISFSPRLLPEETAHSYVVPLITSGTGVTGNDEFRQMTIKIYVYVPNKQWAIKDDNLRPFAIIGEIQSSLNRKHINGMGTLIGGDFKINLLTDDMTCYTIEYSLTNYD